MKVFLTAALMLISASGFASVCLDHIIQYYPVEQAVKICDNVTDECFIRFNNTVARNHANGPVQVANICRTQRNPGDICFAHLREYYSVEKSAELCDGVTDDCWNKYRYYSSGPVQIANVCRRSVQSN